MFVREVVKPDLEPILAWREFPTKPQWEEKAMAWEATPWTHHCGKKPLKKNSIIFQSFRDIEELCLIVLLDSFGSLNLFDNSYICSSVDEDFGGTSAMNLSILTKFKEY